MERINSNIIKIMGIPLFFIFLFYSCAMESSHVSYEEIIRLPLKDQNLVFSNQNSDLVSEVISLQYTIKLQEFAPKPIKLIRLTIEMENPLIYEILNEGPIMIKDYHDQSTDCITQKINFRVKLVNLNDVSLEKPVVFKVYVMDVEENIKSPIGDKQFYSWVPLFQEEPAVTIL